MQLESLLEKMKMDHLCLQLDSVCEQASKRDLGYKEFLVEALGAEWGGAGMEKLLSLASNWPASPM